MVRAKDLGSRGWGLGFGVEGLPRYSAEAGKVRPQHHLGCPATDCEAREKKPKPLGGMCPLGGVSLEFGVQNSRSRV